MDTIGTGHGEGVLALIQSLCYYLYMYIVLIT